MPKYVITSFKLRHPESGYSLFKAGVHPDWTDERNAKGGRWVIHSGHHQDLVWKEIIMILAGFTLDANLDDIVTGAVVNVKGIRSNIAVWITDNSLADEVGKQLQILLRNLDSIWTWTAKYRPHK